MTTNISKREKDVLHLISYEQNTRQIAKQLYISHHTVSTHRKNLMIKLDVKNVAGLVRKAIQLKLVYSLLFVFISIAGFTQTEIEMRTDGIVIPRLDHGSVLAPTRGQMVYDTTTNSLWFYDGSDWKNVTELPTNIVDEDQDTHINVETVPDEDTIRFVVKGVPSMTIGEHSVNWGGNTTVTGINGTAWGNGASANGNEATAWGNGGMASGIAATAWGTSSIASGDRATSWGSSSVASGARSTAHGFETNAGGDDANAWGEVSSASGPTTTAWGHGAAASKKAATAWGSFTTASDTTATAWGEGSSASGKNATSWGQNTVATKSNATAWGLGALALGSKSTAWGDNTEASGFNATAWGDITTASNVNATAWGAGAIASGFSSTAWGNATANNTLGTAWGDRTSSSGIESTAWGETTTASGEHSTAWGVSTMATGDNGTSWGLSNHSKGDNSTSWGNLNMALSLNETVLGRFNDTLTNTNQTAWESDDHLFVIGNGTSVSERSNALSIMKNGDMALNHTFPTARLEVRDLSTATHPTLQLYQNDDGFSRVHYLNNNVDSNYWAIQVRSADDTSAVAARYLINYIDDAAAEFELFANGDLNIGGNLTQNSDVRLKKNIHRFTEVSPRLSQIFAYSYNWKCDHEHDDSNIGLIAQEVQKVFPELVRKKDDGMLSVNYIGFIPILVEANKELNGLLGEYKRNAEQHLSKLEDQEEVILNLQSDIATIKIQLEAIMNPKFQSKGKSID